MLKILTISTTLLFGSCAFAQSGYTLIPGKDASKNVVPMVYDYLQIDIEHNNSQADSIELNWEVIEVNAPGPAEGWDYSYCDYVYCYSGVSTSGTMKKIGMNETAFLKVNLLAAEEGWAYFKFKLWSTGNEANPDSLTFVFQSLLNTENVIADNDVIVYPNPMIGGDLNMENLTPQSDVRIINALGETIAHYEVKESDLHIKNISFQHGVYYALISNEEEVYATKKIIVN